MLIEEKVCLVDLAQTELRNTGPRVLILFIRFPGGGGVSVIHFVAYLFIFNCAHCQQNHLVSPSKIPQLLGCYRSYENSEFLTPIN